MTPADTVKGALLADLHRQVDESIDDGYGLFVGPSDRPAIVHIEGAVDMDALVAVILAAVESQPPQSALPGSTAPGPTRAAHQPAGEPR